MTTYTILLDCGTVGKATLPVEPREGDTVRVYLHDENGNQLSVTGIVAEVLS